MILNHATADTVVQWKLCPNFKFHLKNFKIYDLNRIIDPNGRKRHKPTTKYDTTNTPKKAKL